MMNDDGAAISRRAPATTRDLPAAVELHIEELMLRGFPPSDRFHISEALQQELMRLITEQGLPGLMSNPVNMERLDGGTSKIATGAKPQAIGALLAQRLHQQLCPMQRSSSHGRWKESRIIR